MTLTEFLLARIAEDREELATSRYVAEDHWWLPDCAARARLEDENEAKRQIVALHTGSVQDCVGHEDPGNPACATLCALALPYSDHADFLPEWKP